MNRFLVEWKLGKGSFGEAFLVKSNITGDHYVMKNLNLFSADSYVDAMKEVNFLKQLKHENIVRYKEAHAVGKKFHIIMEYCGGGDLARRIDAQQGRPFSQETIWQWFSQLCFAVQYIHRKGVLHRDIKPPNIFLTSNGTIKLGDFGIAKQLMHTLDRARTTIGTPECLAPEVWEQKAYGSKCDVWSLGCVLYELIDLRSPFPGKSIAELSVMILHRPRPIPSGGSRSLQTIVSMMLEKKPSQRPSIDEVIVGFPSGAKAMINPRHDDGDPDWANYRHGGVQCDGCWRAVMGIRYTCLQCRNYDLCMACEKQGMHAAHPLLRLCGDIKEKLIHETVRCNVCGMVFMKGIWYKCLQCVQFDLCETCYNENKHNHEGHRLVPIVTPLDCYSFPMEELY